MKLLFISGTDTEVGKTHVACEILLNLRCRGHRVGAWKPVCSGAIEEDGRPVWTDLRQLAAAVSENTDDAELLERICAHRFRAPVAPNIAARMENRVICERELIAGYRNWESLADYLVVEGAGGLLSPVSDRLLVADLVRRLAAPLLLVAASRLGAIHQTLTTVEVARARSLPIAAVILSHVLPTTDVELHDINERELRRLMPDIPLIVAAYGWRFDQNPDVDPVRWFETSRCVK